MKILALTIAATFAGSGTAALAQVEAQHHRPPHRGGGHHWQVIGNKTVNGRRDSDIISVPGRQRFRQVRLCASHAPLRLRSFDIFFANGGHQRVQTREIIAAGSCTRAVDLNGQARNLASIHLSYERITGGLLSPRVQVSAR